MQNPSKFNSYSENILKHDTQEENSDASSDNLAPAVYYPMFSWQIKTEKYAPELRKYCVPDNEKILEPAQKWIKFPGRMSIAFPIQTVQPRIRTAHLVGEIPIEVQIDRFRKMYAKLNLEELLKQAGIENWMLTPVGVLDNLAARSRDPIPMFLREGLFPLDWFDDSRHDSMSSTDWLNLGLVDEVRHPIPAMAFLPKDTSLIVSQTDTIQPDVSSTDFESLLIAGNVVYEDIRNELYSWRYVAVKDYDKSSEKWIVTDLDTIRTYKIPRIFLMFIAENPNDFVNRVQSALHSRADAENLLKFELVIDCLLTSGIPRLNPKLLSRIRQLATSNLKFIVNEEFMDDLKDQINVNYQRILVKYEFENFLLKHPEEFPNITVPKRENQIKKQAIVVMDKKSFVMLLQFLGKIHIFYVAEAVIAMYKVVTECKNVEAMSLFTFSLSKTTTLADFLSTQQYYVNTVIKYIKGFWTENMAGQICMCLRAVGKGWLDISIGDWWVYKVSKISRFLQQVRYRMQDTLQFFLESSVSQYRKYLLAPCESMLNVQQDFVWGNDLKISPLRQTGSTIFSMVLNLAAEGAYFSTNPDEFPETLVKILENALLLTVGIPRIDANVMTNLVFAKDLYIPTIELIEDLIVGSRDHIRNGYEKAIIPLKAYATRYEAYIPLYLTNVNDYITQFAEANKTSAEVKEEILLQKRLKENLEKALPSFMLIGPFFVNVEPLRHTLIEKRREIIRRLLEYFCNRMQNATENLIQQFREIMDIISEKPISIEQIIEVREFMTTIPSTLESLEEKLRITILEYDILDYFWYNLSNEHFALKWEAIGWPYRILIQMTVTKEQQKVDIEEFKRIQLTELQGFHDRIETLNEEITAYSLQFDPSKAQEISVDVRKTWKSMKELMELGELLQSRQYLFELSDIDLLHLDALFDSFIPYKNLWLACADFLKLEELSYGNPLANIDIEDIKKSLKGLENTLLKSTEIFVEMPEIANIAETYLAKINNFKPSLEVIECLKDPNWLTLHWQELARRAEIDIKYSIAINFSYCIKKGILEHIDLVKEIAERAIFEADEIKRAMEEEERLKREALLVLLEKRKQRKCRTDI